MFSYVTKMSLSLNLVSALFAVPSASAQVDVIETLQAQFAELSQTAPAQDEYQLELNLFPFGKAGSISLHELTQQVSTNLCNLDKFRCPEFLELSPVVSINFEATSEVIQSKLSEQRQNAEKVEVFYDLSDTITGLAERSSGYQVFVGTEGNTFGSSELVVVLRNSDFKAIVLASGWAE